MANTAGVKLTVRIISRFQAAVRRLFAWACPERKTQYGAFFARVNRHHSGFGCQDRLVPMRRRNR
jgi:hypothetical protein